MLLSVVIPTHNRATILKVALDSFKAMNLPKNYPFELVVIANACEDGTCEVVRSTLNDVDFHWKLVEELMPGLSVARNKGVQASKGQVIVFLDDDITLEKDWLNGLIESISYNHFDVWGGKINLWWNECREPSWFTYYEKRLLGFNNHGNSIIEAKPNMIFGGNFAFKRSVYESVGGFDEKFGRVGQKKMSGEESDFVTKAMLNDFKLGYSPLFIINHLVTPDRITEKALRAFAIGAGRSRSQMKRRTITQNLVFILRIPKHFFSECKNTNFKHARVMLFDQLAEAGLI